MMRVTEVIAAQSVKAQGQLFGQAESEGRERKQRAKAEQEVV